MNLTEAKAYLAQKKAEGWVFTATQEAEYLNAFLNQYRWFANKDFTPAVELLECLKQNRVEIGINMKFCIWLFKQYCDEIWTYYLPNVYIWQAWAGLLAENAMYIQSRLAIEDDRNGTNR